MPFFNNKKIDFQYQIFSAKYFFLPFSKTEALFGKTDMVYSLTDPV